MANLRILLVSVLVLAGCATGNMLRKASSSSDAVSASADAEFAVQPNTATPAAFSRITPVRDDPFNGTIDGHALPTWFSVVFNGCLMGIGGLEVVAGYRLFRYTLMLLGAIAGGVPVFLLTWDNIQGPNAFWFGVGTGAMAALIAAVASFFLWKVGVFVIGAALGVVVALVLNITVLYKLSPTDPNLPLEIGGVILGLAFGFVALRFMRLTVVTSTAVVGSYALGGGYMEQYSSRGIGHFAGGYPANEFDVEQELQNGQTNLPWTVYAYFGAFVVAAIGGIAVQLLVTAKKTDSGKDANEKAFDEAADPLDLVLGRKKKKGKKGKRKGAKSKGGKTRAAGGATAPRNTKVDALLRDYEEGGEFYEGPQGGEYEEYGYEDGEGEYYDEAGGYEDGGDDYGYDMAPAGKSKAKGGAAPQAKPAPGGGQGKSMFSGLGMGRGQGQAKAGQGKRQPAAVNW